MRARLLFVAAALVAGVVLLSCSSSGGKGNSPAQAPPASNAAQPALAGNAAPAAPKPTPAAAPAPVAAAKPNAPAPNAPADTHPQQRLAEPKKVIPAPPVTATGKGPRIAFTNQEVDFGNVEFEEVIRVPFEFKNVGNEPLKITKASVEVVEGC